MLGLLIPAVQGARQSAMRTQCGNNLKNLGFAFRNWKDANDPKVFPTTSWVSETSRYVESVKAAYHCPFDDLSFNSDDTSMYIAVWINSNRATPLICPDYNNSNIIKIEKNGKRCKQSSVYAAPSEGAWVAEFELTYNTNDPNTALDWNDLFMLIDPQPNGTSKVSFFKGDGGGQVLSGGNQIMDLLDQNLNAVASDLKIGQYGFIPGSGQGTSYGINSRAHHLELTASKILLVEYKNTIARVVAPANSELSLYPNYVAERHLGVMNVLFADGHVETRTAKDIDPRDSAPQANLWTP